VNGYYASFDSETTTYDARGNLVQFDDTTLAYDIKGRVVGAQVGAEIYSYAFDAEGRRVLADGWFFTHENKREIKQTLVSDPQTVETFTYGTGIDEVLSFERSDATYTLQKNRNGSTVALTDESGSLIERYDYTPFGEVTSTDVDGGGLVGSRYLFVGRRLDEATGLYFMRARYYSPEMGRFTSRDPIGFWGDANNWGNPFAYGFNNPLAGADPYGTLFGWLRDAVQDAGNALAGVAGGVVEAATFGFVESESVGRALGADVDSAAYKVGSIGGSIGAGVALNLATSGAFGAVDAGVNITRGAIQIGSGIYNGSTESVLSGATSIGMELVGIPGSRSADVPTGGRGTLPGSSAPRGGSGGGPISMDEAVARGSDHVGGRGVMETTGSGNNYQFRNTTTDADGNTVTKNARFDVNPADPHVQKNGPHLNLETQVNGKPVGKDPHTPIDPDTVRPGDIPR